MTGESQVTQVITQWRLNLSGPNNSLNGVSFTKVEWSTDQCGSSESCIYISLQRSYLLLGCICFNSIIDPFHIGIMSD